MYQNPNAVIGQLVAAFYGQQNQHVIDWLRMLHNHGSDKYRPGDVVKC